MKKSIFKRFIIFGITALLSAELSLAPTPVYAATTATVNVSGLNLRKSASTSSAVVSVLQKGTKVTVNSTSGNWSKVTVTINGVKKEGYVYNTYIKESSTSTTTPSTTVSKQTGTVNTAALNLRKSASTSSAILKVLYQNQKVEITGQTGTWYKVNVNGTVGYVSSQYIKVTTTSSGSTSGSTAGSTTGSTTTQTESGKVNVSALNVRSQASTASSIVACISQNTVVKILKTSGDWLYIEVTYSGKTVKGYVYGQYITKVQTNTGSNSTSSNSSGSSNTDSSNQVTKPEQVQTGYVNTSALNIRSGPGTTYSKLGLIYENQLVTILSETNGWYKIKVTLNGKAIEAYASKTYISVKSTETEKPSDTPSTPVTPPTTDDSQNSKEDESTGSMTQEQIDAMIAKFPVSYRSGLKALSEQHPNWIYTPVETGLDWNTVVKEEGVFRKNTISIKSIDASTDYSLLSTQAGAYNWQTDKYTLCDGSTWYSVSEEVMKYYLDPRNYFTEVNMLAFESLAFDEKQSKSVVDSILSNTFMNGTYTETDPDTKKTYTKSYTDTFMEAGKISGASPYYLAAKSRGEVGNKGSNSVTGTYGAYSGYYNFFNIGAYDGTDAVANALKFAQKTNEKYYLPWNTRYKSIVGGSKYIANSYINIGQNTPYTQKFDVVTPEDGLYFHQYMTSIMGPVNSAKLVYNSYKSYGILDDAIVFYIPVYKNMPANPCPMPEKSGNPNSYLKALSLNNGAVSLSETFAYNKTEYSAVVSNNVSSITVSASAVSNYAKGITGTGTYNLPAGETTKINVICTAGNGTKTTYTINVYRNGSAK